MLKPTCYRCRRKAVAFVAREGSDPGWVCLAHADREPGRIRCDICNRKFSRSGDAGVSVLYKSDNSEQVIWGIVPLSLSPWDAGVVVRYHLACYRTVRQKRDGTRLREPYRD